MAGRLKRRKGALYLSVMDHKSQDELTRLIADAAKSVPIGATYWHYKNRDLHYRVADLVIIEATDTVGVIYEALYGNRIKFLRPIDDFLATVGHNGKQIARFTKTTS